jgi:activator of HSP90 ATPase
MSLNEKSHRTSTRREVIAGLAMGVGAIALVGANAPAEAAEEIARNMESIHQEIEFKASPERVYAALTDAAQFHKAVLLSDAVKSGMVKSPQPAVIHAVAGGEFSLFGGYISGRQIELVPNVRLVQAWRTGSWEVGTYSIARFGLAKQGTGTLLTFDHTGFPKGEAEHLAQGWKVNYWLPLDKILAS